MFDKHIKISKIRRNEYVVLSNAAGIAQLVEHDLAKVGVASSSLVSRSIFSLCPSGGIGRRKGFKIPRLSGRASSSLASGTIFIHYICGNSSVGRARPCQGRGREFEPRFSLHDKTYIYHPSSFIDKKFFLFHYLLFFLSI